MQIKIFTIPIIGGESFNEEMNRFLRAKKVLYLDSELVSGKSGAYWSFCVKYIEGEKKLEGKTKAKMDYRKALDAESVKRYDAMRKTRKKISDEQGMPAYLVLTNEEMAMLAVIEGLTLEKMKKIKGIGVKKIEKYGMYFISKNEDEKNKSSD